MAFIANDFWLSGIFVVVSFVLLLFLSFKGVSLMVSALAATLVVCFASVDGYMTGLTTTFVSGVSTLAKTFFLVILSGITLAAIMEKTGVAQKIGQTVMKVLGPKSVVLALVLFVMIIDFMGVSVSTFIFYAIAMPICRQANIPKKIPLMVYLGGHAVMASGWGVPSGANNLLANFFGTSIYDTPLIGIPTMVLGIAAVVAICMHELKKSVAAGEGFVRPGEIEFTKAADLRPESELPSAALSLIPCLVLFVGTFVLQKVTGNNGFSVIIAQTVIGAFYMITNWKRFDGSKPKAIGDSMMRAANVLLPAFCIAGYGAIVSGTYFYTHLLEKVLGLGVSPYILLVLVVMVVCGITGDAVGGTVIVMTTVGAPLMEAGANPAALARLTSLAGQTFDSLPHSYMVAVNLQVFGYDLKSGYKYALWTTVLITTALTILGVIISMIFY